MEIGTLQEKILLIYEPWLCNVWTICKSRKLIGFDEQIYGVMEELFKENIPAWVYYRINGGRKAIQLMKIRKYLKKHPDKALHIAYIYNKKYYE